METYLAYELAPQPTSLFHDGLMRKTAKSVLGLLLKSKVTSESKFQENSRFVIDGGYLLRSVAWLPDATYSKVCECYVSYVRNNFSLDTVVVFDGYESKNSTKVAEQLLRRASKAVSRDLIFDGETKTVTRRHSSSIEQINHYLLKLMQKTLSVSPMLRPIMSETSKTAKIILVLYWNMDLI